MTTPNAAPRFNLYLAKDFFSARMCGQIIAELCRAPDKPATVYGRGESGSVDERMRKAARVMPSTETVELVRRRLLDSREEVAAHFGINLSHCEDPQFLRYRVGDFFVAHQDGNTGLLLSDQEQSRKISVVIFLNAQSVTSEAGCYSGGSLVLSEWHPNRICGEFRLTGEAGTLVAFPSETTHEVLPVIQGERYSIVSWFG